VNALPPSKPPVKVESKDDRITFRVTPTLRELLDGAARANGDELSRYVRDCVVIGHTMRESQRVLKATVG
jgi:uncharacterized protein (DUF1778 family)